MQFDSYEEACKYEEEYSNASGTGSGSTIGNAMTMYLPIRTIFRHRRGAPTSVQAVDGAASDIYTDEGQIFVSDLTSCVGRFSTVSAILPAILPSLLVPWWSGWSEVLSFRIA